MKGLPGIPAPGPRRPGLRQGSGWVPGWQGPAWSLALLLLVACGADAVDQPTFALEVLATDAVEQVDSLPAPTARLDGGRLVLEAVFGLGAAGYQLTVDGSREEDLIEVTVHARMPEGTAGASVLTAYRYRVTSSVLPAGSWTIRLRQAMDDEGVPEVVFEGTVTSGR